MPHHIGIVRGVAGTFLLLPLSLSARGQPPRFRECIDLRCKESPQRSNFHATETVVPQPIETAPLLRANASSPAGAPPPSVGSRTFSIFPRILVALVLDVACGRARFRSVPR